MVLLALAGVTNLPAITVTDTTGWTAWQTFGTNSVMTDTLETLEFSQIVGTISQQAGLLKDKDPSIMWQVDKTVNGQPDIYFGVGIEGKPNVVNFLINVNPGLSAVWFSSIGSAIGSQTRTAGSPNELLVAGFGNAAGKPITSDKLTKETLNVTDSGVVTFALSYATLQEAIRSYAGSTFQSFEVNDFTRLNFVAYTTLDATVFDYFGTPTGDSSSTSSFTSLGMATDVMLTRERPVPEPATVFHLGGFIGVGLLGFLWRRRRLAGRAV